MFLKQNALQYDRSKINIRSKFDPSVRRGVVRWTFLQHGISLTPCWGSIMAMRWTTFYHHSVDCNHGYHRCFFIISLFIEQMDFRLSWLALSTHCTTTCRVQTRLERKHRNLTKNPARNELTVSSRSTWSYWWAWSRRSPRRRPGRHCVFNHQDLLHRILKPALMQRAGVQFDHPTGIHNHKSGYLLGNYYDVLPFKLSLFQAFWKLITNLILRDWNQLSWHWFQSRFENKRQTACASTSIS